MSTHAPSNSVLAHVPVAIFSTVMGVAGLGLAGRKAAAIHGLPVLPVS